MEIYFFIQNSDVSLFRTEIESRIRFFCISGLFLEGRIRVNVNIQDPNIRVTTVDCWATPEKDPFGDLQHYLIETGCGVDGVLDGTLRILENGQSKMAKWQGAVFQFVGYEEVWLHCDIRVCFSDEDCIPQCGAAGKRSILISSKNRNLAF